MLSTYFKNIQIQLIATSITAVSVMCFIIYKASHTSFTHDEAFTYTRYVHQNAMDIISFNHPYLNNHILNTLLMKYSEELFGRSEFVLRLPSIAAFVIYSLFTVLWLMKLNYRFVFVGYLLFILNPYLLEFFSLARGYALSISFLMLSVYCVTQYFSTGKTKYLIMHHLAVLLAIFSNFSMLNYLVVSFVAINLMAWLQHKTSDNTYRFFAFNKISFLCFAVYIVFLFEPIRRLSGITLLDFGGKNGFMADTVKSLVYDLFYEQAVPDVVLVIFQCATVLVVLIAVAIIIYAFIQKNNSFFKNHIVLVYSVFILCGIIMASVLQHYVIGNDYYEHRFALFYYPLFIAVFVSVLSYFNKLLYNNTFLVLALVMALCLTINIANNYNCQYYKDWKWDMDTKYIMQLLEKKHQLQPNKKWRLGVNWLFEPTTNFYRYIWNYDWLLPTHRRGPSSTDDYIYMFDTDDDWRLYQHLPVLHRNKLTHSVLTQATH